MKQWFRLGHVHAGLTTRGWLALLAVPVLLLGLFVVAFRDPAAHLGQVTAAVVNEDDPVTVNGQLTPLGRELAASLVNDDNPNYDWVLTNPGDAARGLASGHYKVVVTIPKDFSAMATSVGGTHPLNAEEAKIRIQSAADVPLADAAVGRVLADAARRSLGTTITENYLGNLYSGLGTMRDKMSEAVDGSSQIAAGADQLAAGTGALVDGSSRLVDGTSSLADGAKKLSTGEGQAATATGDLRTGAVKLSTGLDTLQTQTAGLPGQTKQLADGAAQVADGTQQVADTVVPAADTIIQAISNSPDAHSVANDLTQAAAGCSGSADFCNQLTQLAQRAQSDARKIEDAKSSARSKATTVRDDVNQLNDGAHQVADGNSKLAAAAVQLTGGITDAATGGRQVADGAAQLAAANAQLADGASQLASGADQLTTGASDLHSGATQANDGAKLLATKTHQLADGLTAAFNQIPTFSSQERDHLSTIAATPIASDVIGTDGYTWSAMALSAVVALWAAGMVTVAMLPVMPPNARISSRPTWRLAMEGAIPGLRVGAVQGLLATVILAFALNLTPPVVLLVLLACLVTTALFAITNRALVAAFGDWGRIASIAILALTLATAVTSAQPVILQTMSGYLPTTAALRAVRNAVAGNTSSTLMSLAPSILWVILFAIVMIFLTERARAVPIRSLRASFSPGQFDGHAQDA